MDQTYSAIFSSNLIYIKITKKETELLATSLWQRLNSSVYVYGLSACLSKTDKPIGPKLFVAFQIFKNEKFCVKKYIDLYINLKSTKISRKIRKNLRLLEQDKNSKKTKSVERTPKAP